jgi:two-component system nitrate/nitrite response regulator NarL
MRWRPFGTIIVGRSPLLREGLARILSAAAFRIVASVPSIDDLALDSILKQQSILLIIDANNHPREAVEQIAHFKNQHPTARIAVLCSDCKSSDIVAAFQSGASAYFVSVASCDALIKFLDLVMLGETILPPEILPFLLDHEDEQEDSGIGRDVAMHATELAEAGSKFAPRLSAQERSVLRCLLDGDANKVIARKIHIAEATVKVHIKTILRKIRVENRTQAALWAMSNLSLIGTEKGSAAEKVMSPLKVSTLSIRALAATQKID